MREEEHIAGYLLRVDEIVNTIRGLEENLDDKLIVQTALRSLPLRYDAKVSTIEDRKHLNKLTMDELHGIIIAYKMKIGQEKPSITEATFNA